MEGEKIKGTFEWQAPEYEHYEKTPDWYWGLGVIAVALIAVALYLNNLLFVFVIIIGAFAIALYAVRKPETVALALTERGIKIGNQLYPYQTLKHFWVHEEGDRRALFVESAKPLVPLITIPLPDEITAERVRDMLLQFLPEEEIVEPASHRIMELLRF